MKLARFRNDNKVTPALFVSETELLDCSSFGEDWNESFFENNGLERLATWLNADGANAPKVNAADVTLAPAIARPSKIICIGLNYAAHAAESGMDPPPRAGCFLQIDFSLVRSE